MQDELSGLSTGLVWIAPCGARNEVWFWSYCGCEPFAAERLNITPVIRYEVSRADASLRESESRSCNFVVGSLEFDRINETVGSACNPESGTLSKPVAPVQKIIPQK